MLADFRIRLLHERMVDLTGILHATSWVLLLVVDGLRLQSSLCFAMAVSHTPTGTRSRHVRVWECGSPSCNSGVAGLPGRQTSASAGDSGL